MEGISANVYKRIRTYWKRRGYQRLNQPSQTRPDPVQLGSAPNPPPVRHRRRRFWRVKISRPRVRFGSPKKWLTRFRDAYVKMMLNFANSGVVGGGYGGAVEYGGYGSGFGKGPAKEYDEKMIVEIYKSLVMAQGQLVPRDAAKLASHHMFSAR